MMSGAATISIDQRLRPRRVETDGKALASDAERIARDGRAVLSRLSGILESA